MLGGLMRSLPLSEQFCDDTSRKGALLSINFVHYLCLQISMMPPLVHMSKPRALTRRG